MTTNSSGFHQPMGGNRKLAVIATRPNLPAHSAMSRMKKAAAELREQSSPLGKALYAEKRMMETLDKYILAKSDGKISGAILKSKFEDATYLHNHLMFQTNTSVVLIGTLPEQRRLFKQMSTGEQELAKLQKQAASMATRASKLGKQAVKDDKTAQRQYVMAVDNHKKFKHREVRKMLSNLAEVESQLYQDCWKISEVKMEIGKLYLERSHSQLTEANVHQVDDKDFDTDEEDEFYENVETPEPLQEKNYLQLIDDRIIRISPEPEPEQEPEDKEDIFGSIASLNLAPRNSITTEQSPDYGRVWESSSQQTDNQVRPSESRPTSSWPDREREQEIRYVSYPGSTGDRPANSVVGNAVSSIETELRQKLMEFNARRLRKQAAPPPPIPPRRN
ncbi:hypothetical protein LSH36_554g01006 [Paralvinella palmiformis]|uniref:Uncharacterized protein n=1 Tax=Paralvinella palmiformis TaxID=53620 RepID=A0AAD9J7Q8_9ANNE|nr:hypothetical protein LSH36_554g01006 [Paralvinella palmiformis]